MGAECGWDPTGRQLPRGQRLLVFDLSLPRSGGCLSRAMLRRSGEAEARTCHAQRLHQRLG